MPTFRRPPTFGGCGAMSTSTVRYTSINIGPYATRCSRIKDCRTLPRCRPSLPKDRTLDGAVPRPSVLGAMRVLSDIRLDPVQQGHARPRQQCGECAAADVRECTGVHRFFRKRCAILRLSINLGAVSPCPSMILLTT